ncbi:MAG: DNA-binding protein [Methylococcales bacterium]
MVLFNKNDRKIRTIAGSFAVGQSILGQAPRAGLYKALSAEGNPSFATVCKVAKALGLKVIIHPDA